MDVHTFTISCSHPLSRIIAITSLQLNPFLLPPLMYICKLPFSLNPINSNNLHGCVEAAYGIITVEGPSQQIIFA